MICEADSETELIYKLSYVLQNPKTSIKAYRHSMITRIWFYTVVQMPIGGVFSHG